MDDIAHLHQLGLKATSPRLKVLDIFKRSDKRHLSAEEVYRELLLADRADLGLATVYRVLGQLEQAGILARRQFEHGPAVFEFNDGEHHDHLVCVQCGRLDEFHDPEIEARQALLAERLGFRLSDHRLTLYGTCAGCQRPASAI